MLDKIRNALKKGLTTSGSEPMSPAAKQLAAAALLVEAARRDNEFTEGERDSIKRVVTEHFALSGEEASDLLTLAEERQKVPMGESIFTREVAQGFGPKEKEQVIEMIWEIALGDGQLHRLEATMIDILAQEIGVSAAQSAAAKERAAARLGH
ncbi:tellurite resistance TerB family protein [Parvibaculum sp.]|jgi:uncharacterized tellurite resistance protein B-like protein|uniref:tellurite resistance TerB family protein n=2 Tax=Parvibaculum sp. TaxID=2024848 RepID=UPI002FD9A0A7